jgi:hypothetical protein
MFNLVPGLSIDVYINDNPRVVGLGSRELGDYMPTILGKRNFKVYQSQTDNLLLEIQDFDIPPGQILTYAFFGSPSNVKMLPLLDDINEDVVRDRTKVRFYNFDSLGVTFSANPSMGFTSRALASGEGTNYIEVNSGNYNLELRPSNQRPKTITITFNPGRLYTVYFFGSVNPDSPNYTQNNILQVALVVDGNTLFNKCVY